MRRFYVWISLTVAAMAASAVFAAVPQSINYQGYLKNTAGTPVSTATTIRFSLYSSNPARNNPVWHETKSVTPANGIYSTQLGSVTPVTAPFDVPYWLGVQAGTDPEMSLQPLSSVPYALTAGSIDPGTLTLQTGATANKGLIVKGAAGQTANLQEWQNSTGTAVASVSPAGDLTITGNLNLPATTATTGIIKSGGNRLLHAFGTSNFFAGINSGNLTMSGTWNTGNGYDALTSITSGSNNTAIGAQALVLNSAGSGNTAAGAAALQSNSTGTGNSATGVNSLNKNTIGNRNVAYGTAALFSNTTASYNSAFGNSALFENITGTGNTAVGYQAGYMGSATNANSTGSFNTFIGYNSGPGTPTQLTNATAIGYNALVNQSNSMVLGGTSADAVKVGIGTPSPTEVLDVIGNVRINNKDIYFRDSTDTNHGVGWFGSGKLFSGASLDGPALYGFSGGALGTTSGGQKIALAWDSNGKVGVGKAAGSDQLDVNGTLRINDNDAYLRTSGDTAHGMGFYGGTKLFGTNNPDGPVLYGSSGGILGTTGWGMGKQAVLSWSYNGGVGIGLAPNTTPAAKLEVAGNIKVSGSGNGMIFPDGTTQTTAAAPSWYQTPPAQVPKTVTLTTVDSTGNNSMGYTSITIGTDGLPVISYYDYTNTDLKVAKCANAACTGAATITTIDSTVYVGFYNSIAIGSDGLPIISYYDSTNGDLKVAKCANTACTGATITTVDTTGVVGITTSIAIGTDGLPVISYYDQTNGDLKVAKCSNVACTAATITTVDSTGNTGSSSSIAIGTDGLPVVSYYDGTNLDLKVAKCTNTTCTAATITTVDSTGQTGQDTSITIGSDGLPVISYYDYTNRDLKVAKCANAACTSATITAVDSTGQTGQYTSITIGSDGLPVISYYDYTNTDLKVAKCANAACTGAATISTVDSTGNTGSYTSITVGTDGLPVVSYLDNTNSNLKVAKCANPFCLNYWSRR